MPASLIGFWQGCRLEGPPFAHPADWPALKDAGGRHIDAEPKDFSAFVASDRFGDFADTRLHLSLLPIPYGGNLRTAEIVILLLNPGFSFTDYYAETRVPAFRNRLERTLAQDFGETEFPFLWLDPEYCWHSGFVWWERKLRDVTDRIPRAWFNGRYLDALRDLARRVAHVELVPYHSPSFRAHPPSWNVAPTDSLPIVRFNPKEGQRSLDMMRWGLIPYWAKDIKVGFANINAKAEGIEKKPAFGKAFERRRCLVPVDNFYEWKKTAAGKQPYALALVDRGIMALAGLWRTGARRPASGSAALRSSPPRRTNSAPKSTTACPWC